MQKSLSTTIMKSTVRLPATKKTLLSNAENTWLFFQYAVLQKNPDILVF